MKAAVCEDEKIYSDLLCAQIKEYFGGKGEKTDISVFSDGMPLLSAYENGARFDIVFLDIQLESSDGMDTAAEIRKTDSGVTIVFVTGLEDRAVEGYAVSAFDYIVKSTMNERLGNVLDRFMQERKKSSLTVSASDRSTVILRFSDILWIESKGRGTEIHTSYGEDVITAQPVGKISAELPKERFSELHKSVYARTDAIKRIGSDTAEMINGAVLPLSRRKRKAVMSEIMKTVKGA